MTIKENTGFNRVDLLKFLDQNKIGTRLLFAGNLVNQPYFENINYRISGNIDNTNITMNNTFWIGVQPALTEII